MRWIRCATWILAIGATVGGTAGCPKETCLAAAICAQNETEVTKAACEAAGSACKVNTISCNGDVAYCIAEPSTCDAYPSCPPGSEELSTEECEWSPGTCFTQELCGSIIYCVWINDGGLDGSSDDDGGSNPDAG